jgi:hypothetical protein
VSRVAGKGDSEPILTPPAFGAMSKSLGPLSIQNLGLQYHDSSLLTTLNATFQMGPISFSILGFSLGVNLKDFTLTNFSDIEFILSGMAIGLTGLLSGSLNCSNIKEACTTAVSG